MIKITKGQITNPETKSAFAKLHGTDIPFTAAYALKKIASIMNDRYDHAVAEYKDLFKKYATQVKEGVHPDSAQLGDMVVPEETKEAYLADLKTFMDEVVEIDWHHLNPAAFDKINMSSREWTLLEPFFSELTEIVK